MARKYTRLEQRRYREERRAQAARVADRLMGRKKILWPEPSNHDAAMKYAYNFYSSTPRNSIYFTGITT